MGIINKLKGMINISEEEYYDDVDEIAEDDEEEDNSQDVRSSFSFSRKNDREGKVVDIRSGVSSETGSAKAKVVFIKLDSYEDVAPAGDVINEKKILLLNLETCEHGTAVRILDFITGAAYANNATVQRTASRAYIVTPYNVPLTGELPDGVEQMNY